MKTIIERTDLKPEYDITNISPPGEMLLFDIETTGLKKETTQLYLIGCGSFAADGVFEIRQWLAESALDEREVLEAFFEFASGFKTLVHFNGDGFDIPYVTYKAEYYGFDFTFDNFESFDIYRKVKPLKKFLDMPRAGQKNVEEFLKIHRDDEMNGGILIPYYYEYERTRSEECRRLLLLHNRDDVAGMLQLLKILPYADAFAGKYTFKKFEILDVVKKENGVEDADLKGSRDTETMTAQIDSKLNSACPGQSDQKFVADAKKCLVIEFTLDNPVSVPVTYAFAGCQCVTKIKDYVEPDFIVSLDGDLLQVNVLIKDCTAKIPVKNFQDYFYLPAEDKIVHKDVAAFVDKNFRKKATAKNCFLKEQGSFIPDAAKLLEMKRATKKHAAAAPNCGITKNYVLQDGKGKLWPCIKLSDLATSAAAATYAANILKLIIG